MPRNRNKLVAALAVAAVAGGAIGAGVVGLTRGGTDHVVTVSSSPVSSIANITSGELTVGQIAKAATKGVVEVVATQTAPSTPYPSGGGGNGNGSSGQQAEGTGFVYDTQGHVVTNDHVVADASSVKVTLLSGKSYTAKVIGSDVSSDLAVLKVDAPAGDLPPLTLGDSSTVAVGDGVVAIGDPFGLAGTVTSGIVSALGREISATNGAPIEDAIQTDAAINHGNSGGPLFDLQGKVIGITSQIESDSGGSDGVGFAIPSNTVKQVVDQLIAGGKVVHAFLGVGPATVDGTGVRVASVKPGSAAASAGLKTGDVITAVGGVKTLTAEQLRAEIDQHKPGDKLTLTYLRSGSQHSVDVTLGSR